MPQRKNAVKALRVSKKRRIRNLKTRADLKNMLKTFVRLISEKNKAEAQKFLSTAFARLDQAVKHGLIKKNKADRKKSRLSLQINKLA